MRGAKIVFALAMAFGLISTLSGCTSRNATTAPNSPLQSGLYQVVRVGDKELTIAAPVLLAMVGRGDLIAITVKNTGTVPIDFAGLEIIHLVEHPYQPDQVEEERGRVVIKELPAGHVRTTYWKPYYLFVRGQVWIRVVDIK